MHRLKSIVARQHQFAISRPIRSPYAYSSCYAEANRKSFSTSEATRSIRRSSSIDFTYMPQHELDRPQQNEILRVPILPSNSTAPARADEVPESVIRPEIATMSATGTHIDSPSAISEVTDNHALEISPFDLTEQVANSATTAASKISGIPAEQLKEQGVLRDFWSGLLDDVLGEKKMAPM